MALCAAFHRRHGYIFPRPGRSNVGVAGCASHRCASAIFDVGCMVKPQIASDELTPARQLNIAGYVATTAIIHRQLGFGAWLFFVTTHALCMLRHLRFLIAIARVTVVAADMKAYRAVHLALVEMLLVRKR